jgi:hypothetical protein
MDFTASNGAASGGSYEKPRPGTYTGVLIGVADIGTHVGQYGAKRKLMLRWELHRRKGPSLDSAGNINTITAMYNQSFDVKSSLRPVIEAHVGPIRDGEKVTSREWLGRAAKLVLKESDDGKYTNVDTVAPLDPEEDTAPEPQESFEHWEGEGDGEAPNWCKYMVVKSTEWLKAHGPANGARVPAGAATGDDDSGIPF